MGEQKVISAWNPAGSSQRTGASLSGTSGGRSLPLCLESSAGTVQGFLWVANAGCMFSSVSRWSWMRIADILRHGSENLKYFLMCHSQHRNQHCLQFLGQLCLRRSVACVMILAGVRGRRPCTPLHPGLQSVLVKCQDTLSAEMRDRKICRRAATRPVL